MGNIIVFYKRSASLINAIKRDCAGTVHTPGVSLEDRVPLIFESVTSDVNARKPEKGER